MLRFEGATMRDAIARVKAELGDHAVILATREVRRGLLGTAVEITAAIDDAPAGAPRDGHASAGGAPAPSAAAGLLGAPGLRAREGRAATALGADGEGGAILTPPSPRGRAARAHDPDGGPRFGHPSLDEQPPRAALDGPRFGGPRFGGPAATAYAQADAAARAPEAATEGLEKLLAPLRSELRSLRALVRAASSDGRAATALKTELRAELAAVRELVAEIGRARGGAAPAAAAAHADPAAAEETALTAPSRASVVVLAGPTGAGKTTTIAKLAASAALARHQRVRLITLDTYRVGSVDQIRTFADLIGIPLEVADGPAALLPLLERASRSGAGAEPGGGAADLTLIDTAGRSPRDTAAIAELAAALAAARDTHAGDHLEVHLVIPAATSASGIDELLLRYRRLGPARLLFTKLDEVSRAPELIDAPARCALPVTWVTTGQAVPEDIEQPTPARLRHLAQVGLAAAPAGSRAAGRDQRAA
jgi:flagellar biosynthesis protein FlhF